MGFRIRIQKYVSGEFPNLEIDNVWHLFLVFTVEGVGHGVDSSGCKAQGQGARPGVLGLGLRARCTGLGQWDTGLRAAHNLLYVH